MLALMSFGKKINIVGRGSLTSLIETGPDTAECAVSWVQCQQVVNILQQHNRRYAHGHKGATFMTGRVGPVDPSRTRKVIYVPTADSSI